METPLLPWPRIFTGATRPSVPTPIETLLDDCETMPWPPLASTLVATTIPAEASLTTIPPWALPWTGTGPAPRPAAAVVLDHAVARGGGPAVAHDEAEAGVVLQDAHPDLQRRAAGGGDAVPAAGEREPRDDHAMRAVQAEGRLRGVGRDDRRARLALESDVVALDDDVLGARPLDDHHERLALVAVPERPVDALSLGAVDPHGLVPVRPVGRHRGCQGQGGQRDECCGRGSQHPCHPDHPPHIEWNGGELHGGAPGAPTGD